MNRSSEIAQLAEALAKAQADMNNPALDSMNPHFKSKFASLAAVRNATIPALAKHGLTLTQEVTTTEKGVSCLTIVTHSSGQWMEYGPLEVPAGKADAQGIGSAATYARRYAMQAVCGVVGDEDEDANAASFDPEALAESLDAIANANTVGELKEVYAAAVTRFGNTPPALKKIEAAKAAKLALVNKAKEPEAA